MIFQMGPGSAAEKAGMRVNDLVVRFAGQPIEGPLPTGFAQDPATPLRPAMIWMDVRSAAEAADVAASAEVPEGWSDPDAVSALQAILVLVGIPLLLFLVITLLVYLPAMVRGERVAPGGGTRENQWFGGPRKGTAELAAADTEESKAGGASGRW